MVDQRPAKATPILDGILNDLAWEIQTERAAQISWLGVLQDPIHHQRKLSPQVRYLYILLRDYAYATGGSDDFPSMPEMAYALQAGSRSISNWLDELERAGLITRVHRGKGLPNSYRIHDLSEKE